MKNYWLKLKGEEKPMLVEANEEILKSLEAGFLTKLRRVNKDGSYREMMLSGAEITRLEEAVEKD